MRGSWAAQWGNCNSCLPVIWSTPWTFDGDGRRNIWNSPADIFASVANYLKGHGWVPGRRWGREVVVPRAVARDSARRTGTCRAKRDMTAALPLEEWQRLGVRRPGGGACRQPISLGLSFPDRVAIFSCTAITTSCSTTTARTPMRSASGYWPSASLTETPGRTRTVPRLHPAALRRIESSPPLPPLLRSGLRSRIRNPGSSLPWSCQVGDGGAF